MSILATKQIECSPCKTLFYCPQNLNGVIFDLAFWKRSEKNPPIGFCLNSWVKDNDDAGIGFASNEAAEPLFEFYDCLWQLVIIEWISS